MEHGQETMTIVDENGDEHVCEVIFTFESVEYAKVVCSLSCFRERRC